MSMPSLAKDAIIFGAELLAYQTTAIIVCTYEVEVKFAHQWHGSAYVEQAPASMTRRTDRIPEARESDPHGSRRTAGFA
jgi:hypothetical protein